MKILPFGGLLILTVAVLSAQQPAPVQPPRPPAATASAATERALLDRYCVTCHNDKTRTANFSLQNLDLATVGDHAELWEKVVRKLRAGLMPPPGVRRPSLAEYEGLRNWLESEIDRKAAGRLNPGSIILHRLNRTEYANVIRDLLDLEISDAAGSLYDGGDEGGPHGGRLLEDADRGDLYCSRRRLAESAHRGSAFRDPRRNVGPP